MTTIRCPGPADHLVDAPVRGSVPEATAGRLMIYVGATPAAFGHVQPLLALLGTPHHVGGPCLARAGGQGRGSDLDFSAVVATIQAAGPA